ncbi:hypothetical protein [Fictibacillus sp. JL2B1089]|uniref:hypothetical protein n=1 Tax=Fictibacillus sp. JL2B1089 TaxID=3399565 RepID=UPI003A8A00AE
MKIFDMNGIDYVAANDRKDAITFYSNLTGYTAGEVEEDIEGEVSLDEKMHYPIENFTNGIEGYDTKVIDQPTFVLVPYSLVLEIESKGEPFLISTKEM